MSTPGPMPWDQFSADPRDPAAAGLRASDRDRDVVLTVLAEAYADGRLTREEHGERLDVVSRAKTLRELPPVVADLVLQSPPGSSSLARTSGAELQERALKKYESDRREALSGFVVVGLVVTTIWFLTGAGFFWPAFVMLAAGANLLRTVIHKQDIIETEQRRLDRQQRRSLEPPPDADPGS